MVCVSACQTRFPRSSPGGAGRCRGQTGGGVPCRGRGGPSRVRSRSAAAVKYLRPCSRRTAPRLVPCQPAVPPQATRGLLSTLHRHIPDTDSRASPLSHTEVLVCLHMDGRVRQMALLTPSEEVMQIRLWPVFSHIGPMDHICVTTYQYSHICSLMYRVISWKRVKRSV